jgi:hypothetical protein
MGVVGQSVAGWSGASLHGLPGGSLRGWPVAALRRPLPVLGVVTYLTDFELLRRPVVATTLIGPRAPRRAGNLNDSRVAFPPPRWSRRRTARPARVTVNVVVQLRPREAVHLRVTTTRLPWWLTCSITT